MAKRVGLSLKVRFDVFKRDFFKCCYCGNTPPNVVLEADHIVPVSKGGDNSIDNLTTSCFDCNRGKSNNELSVIPLSVVEKNKIHKEKEFQYKKFIAFNKSIQHLRNEEVKMVCEVYTKTYTKYEPSNKFKLSIQSFIKMLGVFEVIEVMQYSCKKENLDENTTLMYFCKVCWNKINEKNGKTVY